MWMLRSEKIFAVAMECLQLFSHFMDNILLSVNNWNGIIIITHIDKEYIL